MYVLMYLIAEFFEVTLREENQVQIASHPPPDFKVKWFLSVLERRSGQMDPPAFTPEFTPEFIESEVRAVFHNNY